MTQKMWMLPHLAKEVNKHMHRLLIDWVERYTIYYQFQKLSLFVFRSQHPIVPTHVRPMSLYSEHNLLSATLISSHCWEVVSFS